MLKAQSRNFFYLLLSTFRYLLITLLPRIRPVVLVIHPSNLTTPFEKALAQTRQMRLIRENYLHKSFLISLCKDKGSSDISFASQLLSGITEGLAMTQVKLIDYDQDLLGKQILEQIHHIRIVEALFKITKPAAIFSLSDRDYPRIDFVMVAQRQGIPSIIAQHGLDCARYYYDDAYASAFAVWGKDRYDRYLRLSSQKPQKIEICGYIPNSRPLPLEKLSSDGKYWLWATRPNIPEKCYEPSRSPLEGLEILRSMLDNLERHLDENLIIKLHPWGGYLNLFSSEIERSSARDRVKLITSTKTSILSLLPDAKLVFTEDSTVGMEAMFWAKPLIHIHFGKVKPVLPFTTYKAALPAFSPSQLRQALEKVQHLSEQEREIMLAGQKQFLQRFAGPCDEQALDRFCSFFLRTTGMHKET